MNNRIIPIVLGITRCYLIRGDNLILIDGGMPNKGDVFRKALSKLSIDPREIKLIVITHGHWDHIGSVRDIRELTGARTAIHELDRGCLEKGKERRAPGVTRCGRFMTGMIGSFSGRIRIPITDADITLGDEFQLAQFGIDGSIIHTPGHTLGSVSVLLETGEAFVGDLAMNMFPLTVRPGLPIFAEDLQKVKESWKMLLNRGAKTVYPAHGKPFGVGRHLRHLQKKGG